MKRFARFASTALTMVLLTGSASAEGPSLAKTIEWLTGKLRNYSFSYSGHFSSGENPSTTITIVGFSIDDGTLTFREKRVTGALQDTASDQAALSDLSARCVVKEYVAPSGVTIEPTLYQLVLTTTQPNRVFHTSQSGRSWSTNTLAFMFSDRELAGRVAKAFEHLIKLSGGTEDDLFRD
jgi:hypothetical protein